MELTAHDVARFKLARLGLNRFGKATGILGSRSGQSPVCLPPVWRDWTSYILDPTPTIYFDPDASTSANTGTYANPYNSLATLAAAMTGNKAGTILGIKTGTVTNLASTLLFSGIYGTYVAPVMIVPYGSSSTPPVLSGLVTLSGWSNYGGGIYSKNITTEIGSLPHPALWEDGTRLWAKTSLANLQAGGTGYYYYDSGTKTLYVNPADAAAPIEMAGIEIALDISYGSTADTGYITVSGIEVKGTCSNSALRIAASATGSITAASNVMVSGVKVGMSGRDYNSGTNDGILINGPTDAVRLSGTIVRGAYIYDCLNNAIEANGQTGAVIEAIESHDCCGKVVEFYSSVSNSTVRNCRGYDHSEERLTALAVNACGVWVAGLALTSGVGSGTSSADTTKSNSNTIHHNFFERFYGNGLILDAGSGHKVQHNTFGGKSTVAASFIRFNNGLTGCDFSNNLVYLRSAVPAVWKRTGVTGLTGDGNAYCFTSAVTNKFYSDNSTAQTTLANWRTATSMDANSRLIAMPSITELDGDSTTAAVATGVTGLGYVADQLGAPLQYPPRAGAFA